MQIEQAIARHDVRGIEAAAVVFHTQIEMTSPFLMPPARITLTACSSESKTRAGPVRFIISGSTPDCSRSNPARASSARHRISHTHAPSVHEPLDRQQTDADEQEAQQAIQDGIEKAEQEEKLVTDEIAQPYKAQDKSV